MYIRETPNKLADGTKVEYVQLCHNYWDSEEQVSKTKVLYSFGRKDKLDVEKIRNLIDSLSKLIKSDDTLDPEDVASGYKQLVDIEGAFRTMKSDLEIRPMYHRREDRIRAHVKLCWLALIVNKDH